MARGANICIIAINYAPEVTGCGPYTTDLAERLVGEGHQVSVITGLPHYPQWRVPEEHRNSFHRSETVNGVLIKRCWMYVPRRMTAVTRIAYELSFLLSAWWKSLKEKPDVVIAVSPALGDMIVGARLSRRTGASYGILVQDLMAAATTQSNISGGDRVTKIASTIESRYLRQADSVAVITESFTKSLISQGVLAENIVISPNYSINKVVRMDKSEGRRIMGWDEDLFVLTHTGNMGLKQDLGNVIQAIKLVEDSRVRLMLVGDGSQRSKLEGLAKGESRIKFMDLVPEESYSALLAASDVLLVNESPTISDMSLPSKLTSYEASGRLILGAVVPGGNTSIRLQYTDNTLQVPAGDALTLSSIITMMNDWPHDYLTESMVTEEIPDINIRNSRIDWVSYVWNIGHEKFN